MSDCSQREEASFVTVHVLLCGFVSVIVCCIYLCKQKELQNLTLIEFLYRGTVRQTQPEAKSNRKSPSVRLGRPDRNTRYSTKTITADLVMCTVTMLAWQHRISPFRMFYRPDLHIALVLKGFSLKYNSFISTCIHSMLSDAVCYWNTWYNRRARLFLTLHLNKFIHTLSASWV